MSRPLLCITVSGLCLAVVASLSGCAGSAGAAPTPSTTADDRAWTLQPGEAAECVTQAVRERIDRAWAQDVENSENGTLLTPPEMKDNGQSIAEIDEQIGIWRALSPKERIFELCKVVRNRAQIESPSPTG